MMRWRRLYSTPTTPIITDKLLSILESSGSASSSAAAAAEIRLPFRVDQHAFARDKPPHLLHVHAGPGNTILTLTSDMGKTLVATSGGTAGFKKSHRGGAEAAFQACQQLVQKTKDKHVNVASLSVRLKGFGAGREATFRALRALTEWKIVRMTDVTPIPFSGCRSKKARRL